MCREGRVLASVLVIGFLVLLASSGLAEARLVDKTVVGLGPNSSRCFDLELPQDFGPVERRTLFSIRSDCGEWCTLTRSEIVASPFEPVSISMCISTLGKAEKEEKSFNLAITGGSKERVYSFGVCVSSAEDSNHGSGTPCGVLNTHQNTFDLQINPRTIQAESGGLYTYEVFVHSPAILKLDLLSSTGKTWFLTTTPNKRTVLADSGAAPGTGTYEIRVEGKIKGCTRRPGCSKTASSTLHVGGPEIREPGNFSVTLTPMATIGKKGEPISYSLDITNHHEEKDYDIDLVLPVGLISDMARQAKTISRREVIDFNITPIGDKSFYPFKLKVTAGGVSKSLDATISMNEVYNDVERTLRTEEMGPELRSKFESWKQTQKTSSTTSQIAGLVGIVEGPAERPGPVTQPVPPLKEGLDLMLIIIPLVLVVAVLLAYFYRKTKKVENIEEEYY